jgi:pyruvate/2-oxoglutarate dehydrogenase complex dihydrolipoamide dehydrogenase (E3) component
MKTTDVIVIGGGPAGYPAAIRAAQNKLSVACIDEWTNRDGSTAFGGTCLNAGCIPSKALLESTELYHRAQHEFAAHGVKVEGLAFDVAAMQKRKGGIVRQMTRASSDCSSRGRHGAHRSRQCRPPQSNSRRRMEQTNLAGQASCRIGVGAMRCAAST